MEDNSAAKRLLEKAQETQNNKPVTFKELTTVIDPIRKQIQSLAEARKSTTPTQRQVSPSGDDILDRVGEMLADNIYDLIPGYSELEL